MERRGSVRLDINLQCRLLSPTNSWKALQGITENMSRSDILILLNQKERCTELPEVGAPVLVEIDLPANHAFGRKCMQCQATVVRTSVADNGAQRIALKIYKMRFESCATNSPVRRGKAEANLRELLM
jgi:hypothetical protein